MVALAKILWANAITYAHGLRACNHLGGSFKVVSLFKGVKTAIGRVELIKHIDELSAVSEVSAKVGNRLLIGFGQVEVHPTDQNLL